MTSSPGEKARSRVRAPATAGNLSRPPVMADVARLAGVSHQTVSRVLNEHPDVRPLTRERVLAAIRELAYRPNAAARTLVTRRTHTLGVITTDTLFNGPTSMLYGFERAAHDAYFVSVVSLPALDRRSMLDAVDRFLGQGIEGHHRHRNGGHRGGRPRACAARGTAGGSGLRYPRLGDLRGYRQRGRGRGGNAPPARPGAHDRLSRRGGAAGAGFGTQPMFTHAASINPNASTATATYRLTTSSSIPVPDANISGPQVVATILPPGTVVPPKLADGTEGSPLTVLADSKGFDADHLVVALKDGTSSTGQAEQMFGLVFFGQGLQPGGVLHFALSIDKSLANNPPQLLSQTPGVTITPDPTAVTSTPGAGGAAPAAAPTPDSRTLLAGGLVGRGLRDRRRDDCSNEPAATDTPRSLDRGRGRARFSLQTGLDPGRIAREPRPVRPARAGRRTAMPRMGTRDVIGRCRSYALFRLFRSTRPGRRNGD